VNVRVLTEGFDAPITQGVCVMTNSKSKYLIQQILGRALRLHPMKQLATIMFPVIQEEETMKLGFVLKLLFDNDEKYNELYKKKDFGGYIQINNYDEREDADEDDEEENIDMILYKEHLYDVLIDSFGNSLDSKEKWKYTLERVKEYMDTYGERPGSNSKDKDTKQLGQWIGTQTQNYKSKKYIMSDETIYDDWTKFINDEKYKQYFMSNNELWFENLRKAEEYIDINKKLPSKRSKDKDIKQIANWIGTQKQNYKSKKGIMSDETIYDVWRDFINDGKYKQYFT